MPLDVGLLTPMTVGFAGATSDGVVVRDALVTVEVLQSAIYSAVPAWNTAFPIANDVRNE